MDFWSQDGGNVPATVNISRFKGQSGVDEYNFIVRPTEYGSIQTQLEWIESAYQNTLKTLGLDADTAVLRRFFCSDLLNQADVLKSFAYANPENPENPCAVSWICQASVPPIKVMLWAYHIKDNQAKLVKHQEEATVSLHRGELSHYWTTGLTCLTGGTSYHQTRGIFEKYQTFLGNQGMNIADNVMRTWFFVQNIDANYQGLVVARREYFAEHGLTPETHFIASTGIEGAHVDVDAKVTMDAYAINGIRPEQITYLQALDHLSPTHIYGVTFERGTSIAYRDRKHVFISGTASIDYQGNIMHPGNIEKQLDRTLENVDALLQPTGASFKDMTILIVYVRDMSDYALVRQQLRDRFGDMPMKIIRAPVCRPGWLIEVEGQAVIPATNPALPAF